MTATAAATRRPSRQRSAEARSPAVRGGSDLRSVRAGDPVVAVLDGGPVDAEVVDVALASCVRLARDLRLIHMYGPSDSDPTPLTDAFAREYASGAMGVARLVPAVSASAVCIRWDTSAALRRELATAEVLVASDDRARELVDAVRPARHGDRRSRIISVPYSWTSEDALPLGYRLALECELEHGSERADGATTPEALDDAWRVGIACPPLSGETIRAWSACSTWPPRTVSAP